MTRSRRPPPNLRRSVRPWLEVPARHQYLHSLSERTGSHNPDSPGCRTTRRDRGLRASQGRALLWRTRRADPTRSLARQEAFLRVFVSLAFDDHAARFYGRIRADLAARGTPIGANDLLIAAIALAAELTVVTHNTSEFGRISGLALEDWELP